MRKYLIVAAIAGLAAWGSNEAPVDGDAQQGSGLETALGANTPAAAELSGTYEVTAEDGTVVRQAINADGTYVETVDGAEIERGTWHQKGDQMCFDPQGDAIEQCYTGGPPGSDGSFSVEMDGGTARVRRVDETVAAEPAPAGADTRSNP